MTAFSVDRPTRDSYTGFISCVVFLEHMRRFLIDRPAPSPTASVTEFYREEFVKHQQCLEEQREYFSPQAINSVETALVKVISQVDSLSSKADADQVVSNLLREFDLVTRLSAWSYPNKVN